MRLGILSDVHANLHALEAVLARLAAEGVESYVCAGDLVGYGPAPNACVERVAALPGICVAGNHDLIALGRLTSDACIPLARESLAWTAERLSPAARAVLEELPATAAIGPVMAAHGSLDDPQEYVRAPEQVARELEALARRHPAAEILVLGHTHAPIAVSRRDGPLLRRGVGTVALPPGDRYLLNPGSVGQSRDRRPQARAVVLDLDRREAAFLEVPYDSRGNRAALRRSGRPASSSHLSPTLVARVRRRSLRGLARRLLRMARPAS
jgi:predicted phosphodiesterase